MGRKYTYCPDCSHKTVYYQPRTRGEDNHQCRRKDCTFFFYTSPEAGAVDRKNEQRWREQQLISVADCAMQAIEAYHSRNWHSIATRQRAEARLTGALAEWARVKSEGRIENPYLPIQGNPYTT